MHDLLIHYARVLLIRPKYCIHTALLNVQIHDVRKLEEEFKCGFLWNSAG